MNCALDMQPCAKIGQAWQISIAERTHIETLKLKHWKFKLTNYLIWCTCCVLAYIFNTPTKIFSQWLLDKISFLILKKLEYFGVVYFPPHSLRHLVYISTAQMFKNDFWLWKKQRINKIEINNCKIWQTSILLIFSSFIKWSIVNHNLLLMLHLIK